MTHLLENLIGDDFDLEAAYVGLLDTIQQRRQTKERVNKPATLESIHNKWAGCLNCTKNGVTPSGQRS